MNFNQTDPVGRRVMNTNHLREEMEKNEYSAEYIDMCVNYAISLKEKGFPIIFDTMHLSLLIGADKNIVMDYYLNTKYLYTTSILKKKNGGERIINAPSENLKFIQKWILEKILYRKECHKCSTGFIPNKSVLENATPHIGKNCIINLDIKDFFPTIKHYQVYDIFQSFGYNRHLSMIFAGLCTYNGVLPQGSPTSPYLANLVCSRLDERLEYLANKIDADYTRYADDITFSGSREVAKYLSLIKRIVVEENFTVNEKKVRVHFPYHRQSVTGLVVNKKLSIPIEAKKYMRQQIHYMKKFGVKSACEFIGVEIYAHRNYLYGMANYIKMVEKDRGLDLVNQLNSINWNS